MSIPKKRNQVADRGVRLKSQALKGKRLAFALTGGIASTEGVKIIREFRRAGALVFPFMTQESARFITPLSIEWASAQRVILEVGAETDNLESYDLVVVAPATLNTLVKASLGITDTSVTLLIASQLSKKTPLFFVPTMNESLIRHPQFEPTQAILKGWGAKFFEGKIEEDRLKMPEPTVLVEWVVKELKNAR